MEFDLQLDDVNTLSSLTVSIARKNNIKSLDDCLAQESHDPFSIWAQVSTDYFGEYSKEKCEAIKVFWCIDYLGFSEKVNFELNGGNVDTEEHGTDDSDVSGSQSEDDRNSDNDVENNPFKGKLLVLKFKLICSTQSFK
jgi:hypothetical protein